MTRTAAVVISVLLAVLALPLAGIMLTGAPPPSARSGASTTSAGGGSNCGTGTTVTSVSDATKQSSGNLPANWNTIAQFLMKNGYSKNAAAGIDGNVDLESGGNPEQLQIGGGGGGGLIQWTPWQGQAQITGNVAADLAQQLGEILVYNNKQETATPGVISTLNAKPSAAEAAAYYESAFEHPLSLSDAGARSASATAVFTAMTSGTTGGGVTTVTGTAPCPPGQTPSSQPSAPATPGGSIPVLASGPAATAIAYAKAQLGKPYVWGGTGPDGYDCSGLVMMAWRAAGVSLARTSQAQWASLPHITAAQAQPGDLVFWAGADGTLTSPGHVAMFLGNGLVIQAESTGTLINISTVASMASSDLVGYARP